MTKILVSSPSMRRALHRTLPKLHLPSKSPRSFPRKQYSYSTKTPSTNNEALNTAKKAAEKAGDVYVFGWNGFSQLGLGDVLTNYEVIPSRIDSLPRGKIKVRLCDKELIEICRGE